MKTYFIQTDVTDFNEVYVVHDNVRKQLHISPVRYSYNLTLDLQHDLQQQIKNFTQFGSTDFNERVREAVQEILQQIDL